MELKVNEVTLPAPITFNFEELKAELLQKVYRQARDVAEVVHGEWLLRHEGRGHYWECSVCHENPCIYVTKHTKFCPNCGAKMDGDSDES